MKHNKIFITGGHLSPALAFLDALPKGMYESIFIGRMAEMEGGRNVSAEFRLVTNRGIRFIPLITGRLTRRLSFGTIVSLLKMPVGFIQACFLMGRERPSAIVAFGGYIAAPVAIAGWIFRIPILIHEQARVPGFTNRCIAALSRINCVVFADTASYFPKEKTVVTGLPMRKALFTRALKPQFVPNSTLPIIYVTGGTTGAVSMNALVFPLIRKLTVDYIVVHQTGEKSMELACSTKELLSEEARHRYIPLTYIDEQDVSWILQNAKLIVGRSGANTVQELGALGKVSVLIPLPWSAGGEQYKNAQYLKAARCAEIFDQHDGQSAGLLSCIESVFKNYESFGSYALKLSKTVARDGDTRLVTQLALLVS